MSAFWKQHGLVIGITVISVLIAATDPQSTALLRYDRQAVAAGQWWRLITGNLAHLGWSHLFMNLAGLGLIWAVFHHHLSRTMWTAVWLVSALAVSGGLYFFNESLRWYVGLSGVLHGLLLAGIVASIMRGYRLEWALLIFVAGKLLWEQWRGALPGSEHLAGGPVVVDAHLYGAFGGLLTAGGTLLWHRLRSRSR